MKEVSCKVFLILYKYIVKNSFPFEIRFKGIPNELNCVQGGN